MSFDNAQIKGIIAACIVGAVFLGAIGSGSVSLYQKNVNFGETFRTIGNSIRGFRPENTKADTPISWETITGSKSSSKGGSKRKKQSKNNRKTKRYNI